MNIRAPAIDSTVPPPMWGRYDHIVVGLGILNQRVARSFDEYQAQTRQRGRQFARALTAHLPAPIFIFTFGNSHIAKENCKFVVPE